YYLHSTYYSVNPNDPTNIVTTSPDGTMTDILVPAAPGALPIFMPLAQAGVPQPVLVALDPAVRAIIETGYNRTSDPSQQVRFALLPPPSLWAADAQAITAGFTLTAQELPAALVGSFSGLPGLPTPLPAPTSPTPAPLPATALASSPSPATTLNSSAGPQTQLLSALQPTPQGQQELANPTTNAGTEVVARSTSTPTTPAADASAPGRGASQPVSTPTKTDTTVPDASGKTAAPASNRADTPAKRGTPPHSAATDARHDGGAVTGNPTKDTSTTSSSSHTTSESRGSESDK
ncbi:MAG TPA: PE-PPE domain-containing protein, partial [Pseudonocardiaceae bacterium]|nr:PE-PPE domain-containing protein [Pseudonocardiaceae bacterium]